MKSEYLRSELPCIILDFKDIALWKAGCMIVVSYSNIGAVIRGLYL